MLFFDTPSVKINTIALHLQEQIDDICQAEWQKFYDAVSRYHWRYKTTDRMTVPEMQLAELTKYLQDTKHKDMLPPLPGEHIDQLFARFVFVDIEENNKNGIISTTRTESRYVYLHFKGEVEFYREQRTCCQIICTELAKKSPDFAEVLRQANRMKHMTKTLPSTANGSNQRLQLDYFTGGNILSNLIWGLFTTFINSIKLMVSILCIIPYYFTQAELFCLGSASELLSTVNEITNSLGRLIGSLIFPIGIMYSQYKTGSCNVFKGEVLRSIDSIISYSAAQQELPEESNSFRNEV